MERKKRIAEIIGNKIQVTKSKNEGLIGIEGTVIKETKNMIILKTEKGTKRIIKSQITFEMNGKEYKGEEMIGKFIDRITGA